MIAPQHWYNYTNVGATMSRQIFTETRLLQWFSLFTCDKFAGIQDAWQSPSDVLCTSLLYRHAVIHIITIEGMTSNTVKEIRMIGREASK